jgi:hypothetical protein
MRIKDGRPRADDDTAARLNLPHLVRPDVIARLLREPLLHFLLIGIALFVVYGRLAPSRDDGARIVVSQAVVDHIAREYEARWFRPPGDEELSKLIEAHVRNEILYREGLALGLDRDDPVIKRRVRQKLEVIAEEQLARDTPTDAQLAEFLARNPERFRRPGTVSFQQVHFPATATTAELEAARTAARNGADPAHLGQPSMLPSRADAVSLDLVARDFGLEFAAALAKLSSDTWTGPVRSALGLHLMRVTARTPTVVPPLDEVRSTVAREWEHERRVASLADNFDRLRGEYQVVIEATRPLLSIAAR